MPFEEEAVAIYAGAHGYLDPIPVESVLKYRAEMLTYLRDQKPEVLEAIRKDQKFTDESTAALNAALDAFAETFVA